MYRKKGLIYLPRLHPLHLLAPGHGRVSGLGGLGGGGGMHVGLELCMYNLLIVMKLL